MELTIVVKASQKMNKQIANLGEKRHFVSSYEDLKKSRNNSALMKFSSWKKIVSKQNSPIFFCPNQQDFFYLDTKVIEVGAQEKLLEREDFDKLKALLLQAY